MAKGLKTGGRHKGTPNKRTQQQTEALQQASAVLTQVVGDAFDGDAHALLVTIYKNPTLDVHVRIAAAKAALPYEKAPAQPQAEKSESDFVPLPERLEAYHQRALIEASKASEMGRARRANQRQIAQNRELRTLLE